ncbi:TonB-dependent receptor domain-containing protein [Vibrio ostreae]|uniref:TonB-dependent receptor n=1 Tax=Vibrio ostreae TaxID=2841925 RepID=A0A975U8L1_9VIBR|nr:TonB-dependent receptor [Vibrio ostreae]QXO17214.1 TonB-dependent receptor [Vibrio ostreae]
MKFHYSALAISILSSLYAVNSVAATAADDTLVVTANAGLEKKITDAPASVSVVSQQDLAEKNYMDLGEALSGLEGVDVRSSTGKTGGLNISIRGMSSSHTLILIDGIRQTASSDTTPNGFGEMGNGFVPPLSAIDHIEVIRGPMSTLYGSDAIGGVVNIITKKNQKEWVGNVSAGYNLQEHDKWGDTSSLSFNTSGPLVEDKLNLNLRGTIKHREGSSITSLSENSASRTPYPTESDNYNIGGKLSYNINDDHTVFVDGHIARQTYDNSDSQLGDVGTSGGGYEDELKFNEDQLIIGHESTFDFGRIQSDASYMETESKGRVLSAGSGFSGSLLGQDRQLENSNTIVNSKLMTDIGDDHAVTIGGQYWHAEMKDGVVINTTGETFKQDTYALFAEDDWYLADPLILTLGARYEHHDSFGSHVSPRAYLVWNANQNWTVKGGVSTGYRTPSLAQLHDGISGISGRGTVNVIGNPDLDPEESTSYETGVYYEGDNNFKANVTVFVNHYKNAIQSYDVDSTTTSYENVGKAKIEGVEVGSSFPLFRDDLSMNLNYTYTHSEQVGGDDDGAPFGNTAKHMANAKVRWIASESLDAWLGAEYHGKTPRYTSNYDNLSNTQKSIMDQKGNLKAWTVVNMGATYAITKDLKLNGAVYNLLDKDFTDLEVIGGEYAGDYFDTSRSTSGYVNPGRNYWVSVNYDF